MSWSHTSEEEHPATMGVPEVTPEEVVSDEINDIITNHPAWLVRNGVSLVGTIALLFILLSWLVPYPDSVVTSMRIVARNAPKKVLSRAEGRLERLLVTNGQAVVANQPLAYMQTTGDHDDVFALLRWLDLLEQEMKNTEGPEAIQQVKHASLGELQPAWHDFQVIYQEMLQTLPEGYYPQKLHALNTDITLINQQREISLDLKELAREDLKLQEEEHKVRSHLADEQVIAPLEFSKDKSKVLNKSSALRQVDAHLLDQRILLHNKQKEVMETQKQITDIQNRFFSSLSVFRSRVLEWINRYVVVSPQEGKVLMITDLQENQFITSSMPLFYVQPANDAFYGEIVASQAGSGKVATGQSVIIRLDSYPGAEYGHLEGTVAYVSPLLAQDEGLLIHVSLADGMRTNYGRLIPFQNNMKASAEIITEEKRLLESLFYSVADW